MDKIGIILLSICTSSIAHVLLKKGMLTLKPTTGAIAKIEAVISTPWIWGGMCLHVTALVIWLWALSKVDISFAYPFLTLGFVLVSIMAVFWLGETLTISRIIGMIVISIGIIIISFGG